jgi:hypothetical protein
MRLIEEVADVCGMPIVEALVHHFGGTRITVPKLKPIVALAPLEEEARLRQEFGGISLRIPRRICTTKQVYQSLRCGLEGREVAALYGVSLKTVYRKFHHHQKINKP